MLSPKCLKGQGEHHFDSDFETPDFHVVEDVVISIHDLVVTIAIGRFYDVFKAMLVIDFPCDLQTHQVPTQADSRIKTQVECCHQSRDVYVSNQVFFGLDIAYCGIDGLITVLEEATEYPGLNKGAKFFCAQVEFESQGHFHVIQAVPVDEVDFDEFSIVALLPLYGFFVPEVGGGKYRLDIKG